MPDPNARSEAGLEPGGRALPPDRPRRRPPSVPRLTGLREAGEMANDPLGVLWRHTQDHGDTFHYAFGGAMRTLVTSSPTVLRHVLKTNHRNYHKSDIQTERMLEFLGPGLATDRYEEWLPKRQLMQKAFHVSRMDDLARGGQATLEDMLPAFRARVAEGEVSLSREMRRLTFAMVTRAFFGAQMPTAKVEQISQAILTVQDMVVRQIVQPYLIPWWRATGVVRRHQKLRQDGDRILLELILQRRDGETAGDDLLSIMLDAADDRLPMTTAQILADCMQLLIAGHETSSNALSWALYLLDRNPGYIARSLEEFDTVLGDRAPLFSDIPHLKLNRAIVEETLRLFPPFWMIDRVALADDLVDGVEIRKGETLICFIYGVQNRSVLWGDPEAFRPERFDEGLWQHREYMHIPFGAGPRGCIGVNYAMIQILIILRTFLRDFRYSLSFEGWPGREARLILRPGNGMPARISAR